MPSTGPILTVHVSGLASSGSIENISAGFLEAAVGVEADEVVLGELESGSGFFQLGVSVLRDGYDVIVARGVFGCGRIHRCSFERFHDGEDGDG